MGPAYRNELDPRAVLMERVGARRRSRGHPNWRVGEAGHRRLSATVGTDRALPGKTNTGANVSDCAALF